MKKHYLETLAEELSMALGEAVWAFAKIEWITYRYLKALSNDQLDVLMNGFAFRSRAAIIRKLIAASNADEDAKNKALKTIQKSEQLAEKRNIFVHNPWQIWVDLNESEFRTQIEKYMHEEKNMDLKSIRRFVKDAKALEDEMKEALYALTSKSSQRGKPHG